MRQRFRANLLSLDDPLAVASENDHVGRQAGLFEGHLPRGMVFCVSASMSSLDSIGISVDGLRKEDCQITVDTFPPNTLSQRSEEKPLTYSLVTRLTITCQALTRERNMGEYHRYDYLL